MRPRYEMNRGEAGNQDQRAGERRGFEGAEIEDRVRGRVDGGRGVGRFRRVGENRDDHLKDTQGLLSGRMLGRGLGVGVRGKGG